MDDTLAAGDTVEAALVRANDLLGQALEQLQDDALRSLVLAARQEVDEAALLVPAIGRFTLV